MKRTFVGLALLLVSVVARAAAIDSLNVDLNALIDAAAASKNRFAVDITHPVAATGAWTYSVRIPGAISMSFHASELSLPQDAVLTVTAGGATAGGATSGGATAGATATYHARDINHGGLWGRPLLGDTLTFTLSGASASIHIESFQAGYRAIGGVVPDHAHYTARIKTLATGSCTQNYSCNATDANQGPAQATVAVLVGNQYSCTGTLLNNTGNDATPYVLTARHCQNGRMGGGNPDAAATVTVYWDAVTTCGSTLGSIYDGAAITQFGAVTVVEQQDAWLIRLNAPPAANDAYFAGWDATGAAFVGGYSLHHALGNNKQYVGWHGQAVYQQMARATVGVNYESTFWGLVNGVGNTGAGASGSAVFDPAHHVVGSASLAQLVGGENTAGVCPVSPAPAPSDSTATAQYTALSGVWTSTADATSTTGNQTLQSVLDPTNTGKMVVDGVGMTPMALTADTTFLRTDQQLTLSWNVPGALSCTASGGQTGDGWAGAKAASGTVQVSSLTGGHVEYGLSCKTADRVGHAVAAVDWTYIQPVAWVGADSGSVAVGDAIQLSWYSNVAPCAASGGQSGDGWTGAKDASGVQTVSASRAGTVVFTLTCGRWGRVASYKASVTVVAPGGGSGTAASFPGASSQPSGTSVAGNGANSAGGSAAGGNASSGGTFNGSGAAGGVGSNGLGDVATSSARGPDASGGGALDPLWLSLLGALLLLRVRANRPPATAARPAATA